MCLSPYNDPLVITTTIGEFGINHLLVDEGSALSLVYLNYWLKMELKDEFIIKDVGEVASFNGLTLNSYGWVMTGIVLDNKAVLVDIYLMNYNAPHGRLLCCD